MVDAYVLVQAEVGKAAAVREEIARIKAVTSSDVVIGPYDVIVRADARDIDELGRLVVGKIQTVDWVTRTLTCPVVHF